MVGCFERAASVHSVVNLADTAKHRCPYIYKARRIRRVRDDLNVIRNLLMHTRSLTRRKHLAACRAALFKSGVTELGPMPPLMFKVPKQVK